ncbi:ATP-binding protein [Xylanibacter brevis]|uniref:ATP-binding protein n=1 Tax=Xylanibacter brevis TaxID=83231 RepID=UPI001E3E84A2|nr:AAA family ATPase [Xylanibacter brevis]
MILEGARQIGKSFSIREVGNRLFPNFVEINFVEDDEGEQLFKNIHKKEDFFLTLSMIAGDKLDNRDNTLIFLDEIQHYPQYLTMLKFLREDGRYRYIASGSLLGIALQDTTSIPVGSIIRKEMFQLDFEEFLIANGFGTDAIAMLRHAYKNLQSLSEEHHNHVLDLFRRYLLVGGLPDAVNTYLDTHNIVRVREVQEAIRGLYADDASKYEKEHSKKLLVRRIYEMIPSQMENKKKRIVAREIRGKEGDRFSQYQEEFEYLVSSGIALSVHAISNPRFPLSESLQKNLLKLYLNDVGLLTGLLYHNNIRPILDDIRSINLGSVYESVVAQELRAHGHKLFYYDNRKQGEVDYLIDDHVAMSAHPIEVKSGKDYTVHSALNNLLNNLDYNLHSGTVISNEREVYQDGKVTYMPVYFVMFMEVDTPQIDNSEYIF